MNKFKILTLSVALLGVAACSKTPADEAHKSFVAMCSEDPRSKAGFSCECQADILKAVLLEGEMTQLVQFLNTEKTDRAAAIELGKDPKFIPMFKKIGGIGLAIHDKCGGLEQAQAQAQPQQAPAAAAPAPAAKAEEAPAAEEIAQ